MTEQNVTITENERNWATIVHLSALAGYLFPLLVFFAPLLIWLLKRNQLPFVDDQGKEAVNFQLTMFIAFLICIPLMLIVVGFILAAILGIVDLILIVVAAINANNGKYYRYPFNWRLIK